MGLFDWFGERSKGRVSRQAREAEQAARALLERAEGELDSRVRLQRCAEAVAIAPAGSATATLARTRRARLVVLLRGDGAVTPTARQDLLLAARELLAVGETLEAARAFELAGDRESQARALALAGEIDRLEELLDAEQERERKERRTGATAGEIELLMSSGQRREALAMARAFTLEQPGDERVSSLARAIEEKRARGPLLEVELSGVSGGTVGRTLVFGDTIVIGRTEGALRVASAAVSRSHLSITRRGQGGPLFIEDLGSHNGTQLHGMELAGALEIKGALELTLGGEVTLTITPRAGAAGPATTVDLELAGRRYHAPLGPFHVGCGDWTLDVAPDGWVELTATSHTPFFNTLNAFHRISLLTGDAISSARGAPPCLRVLGSPA